MSEKNFQPAAKVEDLPAGCKLVVELSGKPILLCHTPERIFAIINQCSHAQEPLECGRIKNGWISCPVHGARFDLETGEALNPPAKDPVEIFAVRVVGGMIEVEA